MSTRKQLGRKAVVAIPNHAGNCNVNISAALDKRKKLFVKISLVAAEIIVGVRAHNGIEKHLSRRKECAHSMTANEHTGVLGPMHGKEWKKSGGKEYNGDNTAGC